MAIHRVLLADYDDMADIGYFTLRTGDFNSIIEQLNKDVSAGKLFGYHKPKGSASPDDQGFSIRAITVDGHKVYGDIEPSGPYGPLAQQLIDQGRLMYNWMGVSSYRGSIQRSSGCMPDTDNGEVFLAFTGWGFYDREELERLAAELYANWDNPGAFTELQKKKLQ